MRFLYKRPKMELIDKEINSLLEIMTSDAFIYLDLFVISLVFTLLLSPVLQSISVSILFFFVSFAAFFSLYFFVFNRLVKKN
ncbi:hypothetical protein BAVI_12584 [Neobacillus vireti LMG 21834]|uniref:Uncharacterized protein n=1 Tax=Neobacillus vireti LMG 21834 TaxID=1131730 RepID=A0AB94IN13_9BACI|nr:hypothetical protein BAVI_12584 [Neobacillus vireti LMG 21834]KLT17251.1 hypothetical protein AA980_15330 [Neobacillus vireti]